MSTRARTLTRESQLFRASVVSTTRLTPNMQRVTVRGDELRDFPWRGYDHWFRLFLRHPHQERFHVPEAGGEKWWQPYLAMPDEVRPHCANYTVADFRAEDGELDIDVVVHRGPDGELAGTVAIWACSTGHGEELALIDQGILFDPPADASSVLLVADESGLPAVAGILRSLAPDTVGRVFQEVPTDGDRRTLAGPPGVRVEWIPRTDPGTAPGSAALAALRAHRDIDPDGYAFVVGEQTLATEGRRHLHRAGMPKDRITFSGFWKSEQH